MALVWIGFLAFFVVSLVVGVRLLLLWRKTRQLPELLIGTGVLGIGPVGFGAMMLGSAFAAKQPSLSMVLMGLGSATVYVGVTAKCIFNWRVYHAEADWARALTMGVAAFLVGVFTYRLFYAGFDLTAQMGVVGHLTSATQIGCLLWGSGEAFHYWGMMRRRVVLGLADPVVTNRFFLWGLGAGAAGLGTAIGTVAAIATGANAFELPWVVVSSSAHGFVAAVAMSLAFVPPSSYRQWIAGSPAAT